MNEVRAPHPDHEQLTRFLSGRLDDQAAADIERHLEECDACCDQLAELDTQDKLADRIANAAQAPTAEPSRRVSSQAKLDHSADDDSESKPSGTRTIGRFEVLEAIGEGGMGTIYRVFDPVLRRQLAIKILKSDRRSSTLIARLVAEARICGRLAHPGIPPVHELRWTDDGTPYISMKLIGGQTLSELLRQRRTYVEDRSRWLQVFYQVCNTVAYAHAQGVIHRDLKPVNVMVGEFGEVHVMDWGLGKLVPSNDVEESNGGSQECKPGDDPNPSRSWQLAVGPGKTLAGSVMGTPAYMPPEQAAGRVHKINKRSDVFALGAILCEILTGRPAYVGDDDEQERASAIRGDLTDAYEALSCCGGDPAIVTLCRDCLSPDPQERPANAEVVANRLGESLQSIQQRLREAEMENARISARAESVSRRRRYTLVVAALLAVLVVVIGATWFWISQTR